MGCTAIGIDPSASGIEIARRAHPTCRFEQMEATADLLLALGEEPFDIVVSTEVVEHLYDPPAWAEGCYTALAPGGKLIGSTPYHGWLKDVALAVSGKSDFHHDSLRVGGHIKFFSNRTLRTLLASAGFRSVDIIGVGRLPLLWYSAVFCSRR
jgi:2-polyprenyl-6-hydroxyphenyl methylase/3-demethylubiquinone-9 3-methyltransferase